MNAVLLVVSPGDPLVARARARVREEEPAMAGILFGGDRWTPVRACAVVIADGRPVALGTLAPTDEMGGISPTIIGLWVAPAHRRQGIGRAVLEALARESARRYGQPAQVWPVTPEGERCVRAAQRAGATLIVR